MDYFCGEYGFFVVNIEFPCGGYVNTVVISKIEMFILTTRKFYIHHKEKNAGKNLTLRLLLIVDSYFLCYSRTRKHSCAQK